MSRLRRKDEHLLAASLVERAGSDFSEISLIHNCLPESKLESVSLETDYMGRTYRSPLFINALTGGTALAAKINAQLAMVARCCGLPLAVGSQMIALEHQNHLTRRSFRITRSINRSGAIWANIGAYATPAMALEAVNMLNADALQVHLNSAQEINMPEGERDFKGTLERIKTLAEECPVPVIIKEVGFGIAAEEARLLARCGVKAIDVAGHGGTNFIEIEALRSGNSISQELYQWGIPTAISLAEVCKSIKGKEAITIFASGGMHNPASIVKALAIGADAIGLAGFPLSILMQRGRLALIDWIRQLEKEIRKIMLLTGSTTIQELSSVPLVITGYTAEWLQRRGFNPDGYARRKNERNCK